MAETVALSFVTFVVKKLVADARPKGGADEIIIRNCVAEIREASYDAEAAIATFVVKIAFRTSGRLDQFPFVLKRIHIKHRNDGVREGNGQALWWCTIGNCGIRRTFDNKGQIGRVEEGKLRLDGLSKLETLENFETWRCDVRCLSKLTNLRKFSGEVAPKDLVVMLKSPILNNSNRLLQCSSFDIGADFRTEEEQSLLRQLLGCQHLRRLRLWGSLNLVNKLPDQFPPNLTYLSMANTELEEDPMPTLEKFPNLRTLSLCNDAYIGKEMVCSSAPPPTTTTTAPSSISGGGGGGGRGGGYGSCDGGGFPKLISLRLSGILNLEEWRVEQGAMPCLFRLEIEYCRKLKEIPDGLMFITTLRELLLPLKTEGILRSLSDVPPAHYNFKIEYFSSFLNSKIENLESGVFEAGGYKWIVSLYPNGNKKRKANGHISLYLAIAETKTLPVGWEVHVDAEGGIRRFHWMKTEWGFDELVLLNTFNDASNGYLFEDCCVFGAEVFVIKHSGKGECISMMKDPLKGTYTWKIDKFSEIVNENVLSEEFVVGGHKCYGFIRKDMELQKLRIKNQINMKHFERGVVTYWFSASGQTFGYPNFMSLNDLNNAGKGFKVNDAVIIEAQIMLLSSFKDF
ncbi:putative disease resistance RPP8-like protein 2 [Camellia lanceoleosa]|uniref:Disease resistance RPP8-like protein 2 n=1 Tax=Camellia lanceoleosa TaxID=1840588 RepID=A0ACC0ISC6_9ERIC|nr:putative disease resistance RPP8-like protein 2 [Camellia lanceoleosa]